MHCCRPASLLMVMPPYHGATIRVPEAQTFEFFAMLSNAIGKRFVAGGHSSALPHCERLGGMEREGLGITLMA